MDIFNKRVRKNYQKISIKIDKYDFYRKILYNSENIYAGAMKISTQTNIRKIVIQKNFRKFLTTFGLFIAICKFEPLNS